MMLQIQMSWQHAGFALGCMRISVDRLLQLHVCIWVACYSMFASTTMRAKVQPFQRVPSEVLLLLIPLRTES